jgi:hypothetical protein
VRNVPAHCRIEFHTAVLHGDASAGVVKLPGDAVS